MQQLRECSRLTAMAQARERTQNNRMNAPRDPLANQIWQLLADVRGRSLPVSEVCERALDLAPLLLEMCERETWSENRAQANLLSRLMNDKRGQVFTTLLTDRAYRSQSMSRSVEQACYLLHQVGAPSYLGAFDRLGMRALDRCGGLFPNLTGAAMLARIRSESNAFVLPDDEALDGFLRRCSERGIDVNVNHLGEEVLGEAEAERRVTGYIALLARPGVETMSVKASSICSQLDALAFERSVSTLVSRLVRIYRAAAEYRRTNGEAKLVVLDMEAYRDVDVTVEAFQRALSEADLTELSAGIALQTYLPETLAVFRRLSDWAERRVARGGAPIRVRLVKGANLAMERVEASLNGWRVPILPSKTEVDANFKRVLLHAARSSGRAVQIGVASHNLLDVCFGMVLRSSARLEQQWSFELLHGMAEPLQRSLRSLGAPVLVYAPVVGDHEFPSAIAYLVRRLDENTSADNYLRHSFGMRVGSEAWQGQVAQFQTACGLIDEPVVAAGRGVDRREPVQVSEVASFENEPDTDFSFAGNRTWIDEHLHDCWRRAENGDYAVHSIVGGAPCTSGPPFAGFDPSRPGAVPYRGVLATDDDVARALTAAAERSTHVPPSEERVGWLMAAAHALATARGELIALMVLDAGKRVTEADAEVSEAIDFARYYAVSFRELLDEARAISAELMPRGPVVITPPWNFPLAIPLGGVFAALVSGNPVILKPALETPLVAARACEVLWNAGVPKSWLQLVVCEDDVGSRLITDARSRAVVLTGGTATARKFLAMRPELHLLAETGGKNALYVSDMSDRELAIADVVRSAFGHAGQKCSALSQLILHREVYADRSFRETLVDAVASIKVGSAWDPASIVTPMIMPPNDLQRRALSELEPGQEWLMKPRFDPINPRLVSPGVKWGVLPNSAAHVTEYFCPLLSVLCAGDLEHALTIANDTSYGLTAGLHSLDEREQQTFVAGMQAGNLYINRPITGAIVARQPFGGWKDSSFGSGAKAGGPNYVAQFVRVERAANDVSPRSAGVSDGKTSPAFIALERLGASLNDDQKSAVRAYAEQCAETFERRFAVPRDVSSVLGEENLLRYRPLREVVVCVASPIDVRELVKFAVAAATCSCATQWFALEGCMPEELAAALQAEVLTASALTVALSEYLALGGEGRLRALGPCPATVRQVANHHNVAVVEGAVSALPRLEIAVCLREQALSTRYHRYGHYGMRAVRR